MVSNKLSLLFVGCFALIASSSASLQSSEKTSPQVELQAASIYWNIPIATYDQLSVCALVEIEKPCETVKKMIAKDSNTSIDEQFLEFKVKVVDGIGVDADTVVQCYTLKKETFPVNRKYKRFLLLGWASKDDRLKMMSRFSRPLMSDMLTLKVDSKSLYACILIPTQQSRLIRSSNNKERAFLNLAEVLSSGTDINTIRQITSYLATVKEDGMGLPQSLDTGLWIKNTFTRHLLKYKVTNPVEKLRINGLLADWLKPKGTIEYIKGLPETLKDLHTEKWSPMQDDRNSDLRFIGSLSLCYRIDPDELVSLALSDQSLRFLIFGVAKPSLENQQKLLTLLEDPNIDIRSSMYSTYAGWYGNTEWLLNSMVRHSNGNAFIPNEEEMRKFWHEKFGVPIGP